MKKAHKSPKAEQAARPISPSVHEMDAILHQLSNRVYDYLETLSGLPDLLCWSRLPKAPEHKDDKIRYDLYLQVCALFHLLIIRSHMRPSLKEPLKEEPAILMLMELLHSLSIPLKEKEITFDDLFDKISFHIMRQIARRVDELHFKNELESLLLMHEWGNNLLYSIIFIALHNPTESSMALLEKIDGVLTTLDERGLLRKYGVHSLLGLQTTLNKICIDMTTVRAESFDEYCRKLKDNIRRASERYDIFEKSIPTPSIKSILSISDDEALSIDFISKVQNHWFEIKRFAELYPSLHLSEATQHYNCLGLIKYFFINELSAHRGVAIPLDYQYQITWSAAQAFAILLSRHKNHRISSQLSELLIQFMGDIRIFDMVPIFAQNGYSLDPLYQAYEIGFAGAIATLAVKNTEKSLCATYSTYKALHDGVKTFQPDVIMPFGSAVLDLLTAIQLASMQESNLMTHFRTILTKAEKITTDFEGKAFLNWPTQTKSYVSRAFAEVLKRFYDKYLSLDIARETLNPIADAIGMTFIALAPPLTGDLALSTMDALKHTDDPKEERSETKDKAPKAAVLVDEETIAKNAEELIKMETAEKARKKAEAELKKKRLEQSRQKAQQKEEQKRLKQLEEQQRKAEAREAIRLRDQAISKEHAQQKQLEQQAKITKSTKPVSQPSPIKKAGVKHTVKEDKSSGPQECPLRTIVTDEPSLLLNQDHAVHESAEVLDVCLSDAKPALISPITPQAISLQTGRASSHPGFFSPVVMASPASPVAVITAFREKMASPFLAKLYFSSKAHLEALAHACGIDSSLIYYTKGPFIAFHWPDAMPSPEEWDSDFLTYLTVLYVHQHQKAPPYDWPVFNVAAAMNENHWLDKLIAFRVYKDCTILNTDEMLRVLELIESLNQHYPSREAGQFIITTQEKVFQKALSIMGSFE